MCHSNLVRNCAQQCSCATFGSLRRHSRKVQSGAVQAVYSFHFSKLLNSKLLKSGSVCSWVVADPVIVEKFQSLYGTSDDMTTVEPWIASIIRSRNVLVIQNIRISK
jgi:uncharacterized protein CbrC (UPF0167 family)